VQAQGRDGRGEDQIDLNISLYRCFYFWYFTILLPYAISLTKVE
jgi:hypothetical protein